VLPVDERGRAAEARLQDRYTFEGFLGQGGFAAVYRVRNLRLDRSEALKVLFESRGSDPKFAARFEREARVAASLEHPNIVRVYDFGNADGTLWYSMQYVDGPTLKARLELHGRMHGEDAAALLVPLLEALEVVHRGGIVHRDVKPDNIILDADERPYLMDFGIVKRDDNVQETLEGKILGTPGYLSPEQLRGHPLDGRSDLYAAGVTLYQMVTGELPFRSDDRIEMMTRRLTEDPEPPSAKARDLAPELERVVLKALARERESRFATAAEMRVALETFLGTHGASARSRSGAVARVVTGPHAAVSIEETSAGTSVFSPPAAAAAAGPKAPASEARLAAHPRRAFSWLPAIVALVLAAVGVTALLISRKADRTPSAADAAAPLVTALPKPSPAAPAAAVPSTAPAPDPSPERPAAASPALRPTAADRSLASQDPAPRVPRVPLDVEEEAPIILSPALAAACEGKTVGVTVTVGGDGRLKSSRVVSKATPECDAAAIEVLSRYRFRAERDEHDRPVEGRLTLSVRF
jgi:eukaryotic-like serine/threonine-protein kinase